MIYKLSVKPRVVVKFGGSSVRDSFGKALELVEKLHDGNEVVVVLSALKGVTDSLLHLANSKDERIIQKIAEKHERVIEKLGLDSEYVENLLLELRQILRKEKSFPNKKAFIDHVLSFGERLSVELFTEALRNQGIESIPVDAFHVIRTDNTFGNANVDFRETAKRVKALEDLLKEGKVPVVTGFLGGYKSFRTTLGRGGSDYTASILGSLLNAKTVLIMSDVEGIYTADPRVVRKAKLIPFVSYEEALIASKLGMKALHERTIKPVKDRTPIIIGRTSDWKLGTLVSNIKSRVPIITYKIIDENFARIGVVGIDKVDGKVCNKGKNWVCFLVRREELENSLNALHEVIFDEGFSSSDDSELWTRI
ncbi:MAG TPA: aspartate kinase [Thermococcus paralvinellae]|uniref:Aspartokinase n=1 Tax=Thermococcus paralvinellae TaxID=582419 RepID=A0A832ZB96_9EURY|nr:aspartate kinase [Thermococcus paralvinellae]